MPFPRFVTQLTTMFNGDGSGKTQAQPRSFADGFRGEKRLHDAVAQVGGDSVTIVDYRESNAFLPRFDLDGNPLVTVESRDGIERILQKVQEHLHDLDLAAADPQRGVDFGGNQLYGMNSKAFPAQFQSLLDHLPDESWRKRISRTFARDMAKALYDRYDPLGSLENSRADLLDGGWTQ